MRSGRESQHAVCATKTLEQQSCLMLHRTRHLFIRQQTAVINSIRAHLAEFGIVAPVRCKGVIKLLHVVADPSDQRVPAVGHACVAALGDQLHPRCVMCATLRREFGRLRSSQILRQLTLCCLWEHGDLSGATMGAYRNIVSWERTKRTLRAVLFPSYPQWQGL